jgi:hypothetical protein
MDCARYRKETKAVNFREEFIQKVKEHEATEQPEENLVYWDGDLDEVIEDMGATMVQSEPTFIIRRGEETAEFEIEELENRFHSEYPTETLITLY